MRWLHPPPVYEHDGYHDSWRQHAMRLSRFYLGQCERCVGHMQAWLGRRFYETPMGPLAWASALARWYLWIRPLSILRSQTTIELR